VSVDGLSSLKLWPLSVKDEITLEFGGSIDNLRVYSTKFMLFYFKQHL
jgi:hypothetical protein